MIGWVSRYMNSQLDAWIDEFMQENVVKKFE